MSDENSIETPPVATDIPDGPSELPADPGETAPNLNPPVAATGEPEPEKKAKPEPAYKHDPRNAIYRKRSQILSDDQRDSDQMFDEGRQTTALPREEPAQPATPVASADEFVTIKVYGVERQAPKADVERAGGVAAYQKAVAAEVKLEQAARREAAVQAEEARLLRIANNLKNGLDEFGRPIAPKPPSTGVPASAINKEVIDAAAAEATKAIYSGDQEEATRALATAMAKAMQAAPTATADPSEVVRVVTATVREQLRSEEGAKEAERDVKEANRVFLENYKDIASDPEMMVWAKGLANTLSQSPEYQGRSRTEIAQEVGRRIREKLGKPTPELESRRQLKETLPQSPRGSGRVPGQEPKRFPTNADYIQQLRRNSGSNSAPR